MYDLKLELQDRFSWSNLDDHTFHSVQSYLTAWRIAVLTNVYDLREVRIKADLQRLAYSSVIIINLAFIFHDGETDDQSVTLSG